MRKPVRFRRAGVRGRKVWPPPPAPPPPTPILQDLYGLLGTIEQVEANLSHLKRQLIEMQKRVLSATVNQS